MRNRLPALLYAALLILYLALLAWCVPIRAHAAIGEAPLECVTIASDMRAIRESGAPITPTVFTGPSVKALMMVLADLGAPLDGLADVRGALLMVGGPDADPPVVLKFFGPDGCAISALATDHNGAAVLLQKLGEPV